MHSTFDSGGLANKRVNLTWVVELSFNESWWIEMDYDEGETSQTDEPRGIQIIHRDGTDDGTDVLEASRRIHRSLWSDFMLCNRLSDDFDFIPSKTSRKSKYLMGRPTETASYIDAYDKFKNIDSH